MNEDEEIIKNLELLESMGMLASDNSLEMMNKLKEFEAEDDLESELEEVKK